MNMTHPEKQVRRKSRWRKQNAKRAAMFARMRAAKEAKRVAALAAEPMIPDVTKVPVPKVRSGFRVTITCLDDGGSRVVYRLALAVGAVGFAYAGRAQGRGGVGQLPTSTNPLT